LKKWIFPTETDESFLTALSQRFGISKLCAGVLAGRGLSENNIKQNFAGKEMENPFALAGMDKAAQTINSAIENGDIITVWGDYDADGITASAIVYRFLSALGADITAYIPERSEGYGLNTAGIDILANDGVSLIITVDCGISAFDEIAYAKSKGITVVVTDHHQLSKDENGNDILPPAAAVNPHRQDDESGFSELCGAGVALKLCAALDDGNYDTVLAELAEFAAIGTVGDMVSLTGENRVIVKRGLQNISKTEYPGINALILKSGITGEINASTVAFGIVPRLNSAGRYGVANRALTLFLTDDEEEAFAIAEELDTLNTTRRSDELLASKALDKLIEETPSLGHNSIFVAKLDAINPGLAGLVASRASERFCRPAIILVKDEGEDNLKGSGRSCGGFNMHLALTECAEHLVRFGGHPGAAGLTIDPKNLDAFRAAINEYADKTDASLTPLLTIDAEIADLNMLNITEVESLNTLAPFGRDNTEPVFLIRAAKIVDILPLSDGNHIKLVLSKNNVQLTAVYFGMRADTFFAKSGDYIDLTANLNINVWQNKSTVQAKIKEALPAGFKQDSFFSQVKLFDRIMTGKASLEITADNINYINSVIGENARTACAESVYLKYKPRVGFAMFAKVFEQQSK
jgi:single-stranded-DNA-specific exonuclease RecJ